MESSVLSEESFRRSSSRISFAPGTKEIADAPNVFTEDLLEVDEVGELLSAPKLPINYTSTSFDADPFDGHISNRADPLFPAHMQHENCIPEERIAVFEEDPSVNPWLVDDSGKVWSSTHIKIIALIALYGRSAIKSIDNETWILQVPLLVLIYEGIVRQVFDGDYAPASTLVSIQGHPTRRIWMNISQEGKGAVDDLREAELVNGLKLNSDECHIVTAYQVSKRGLKLLARAPTSLKLQVELFCTEPELRTRRILLDPVFSPEHDCFQLVSRSGNYCRNSKITDCEDVSYVSSPFIPSFLLTAGTVLESFSHRAHESAAGESGIEDELSEEIQLAYVKIVVAEYIPFGNNLMAQLNNNLGVEDRIPGGMFTSAIDKNSSQSSLQLDPGLTDLKIIGHDYFSFANITAEINFPEDDGIVQVENFGIHMHKYGLVICGMKLEAILDRKADDISLDHLARVLVDVQQDSSKIMHDIISETQRNLMNLVFMGDEMSRCKYNLIMSSRIIPKMRAKHYMDRGRFEKEIKQVIGDLISVHDLSPTDMILLGTLGCIVCGPNVEHHEEMIVCYVSLLVKDVFMRSFFDRMFTAYNHLSKIKRMLSHKEEHPENVQLAQEKIQAVSKDIVQLSDLLTFIFDSVNNLVIPPPSTSIFGKQLNDVLDCTQLRKRMIDRCNDLDSLLTGYKHELSALQEQLRLSVGGQLLTIYQNTASNTDIMYKNSKKKELQLFPSLIMQAIFSASVGFNIIDHLGSGDVNLPPATWLRTLIEGLCKVPLIFWALNMIFVIGIVRFLFKRGKKAEISFWGQEKSQYLINKKITSLDALDSFLQGKPLESFESRESRPNRLDGPANIAASATWTEIIVSKGPGSEKFQPKITMRMDMQNHWLTSIMIETNTTIKPSIHVFRDLLDELARQHVLLGSSVSQLKVRYMPEATGTKASKGAVRTKRVYRDNSAQPSNGGSAKSRGSQLSAEEALEKFREEMELLKQMQLEAKPSGSQTGSI